MNWQIIEAEDCAYCLRGKSILKHNAWCEYRITKLASLELRQHLDLSAALLKADETKFNYNDFRGGVEKIIMKWEHKRGKADGLVQGREDNATPSGER